MYANFQYPINSPHFDIDSDFSFSSSEFPPEKVLPSMTPKQTAESKMKEMDKMPPLPKIPK